MSNYKTTTVSAGTKGGGRRKPLDIDDACCDSGSSPPPRERSASKRGPKSWPEDVKNLAWAADRLGIGKSTAYRIAPQGEIPGVFKVGSQWRVSVLAFERAVHGSVAPSHNEARTDSSLTG